jgi:hypothetical protein
LLLHSVHSFFEAFTVCGSLPLPLNSSNSVHQHKFQDAYSFDEEHPQKRAGEGSHCLFPCPLHQIAVNTTQILQLLCVFLFLFLFFSYSKSFAGTLNELKDEMGLSLRCY